MVAPVLALIGRLALRSAGVVAANAAKAAALQAITSAGVPKVDISMLGDKELQRKLNRLASPRAKAVVRAALRKGAKRAKQRVIANLSGAPVQVRTGELRAAFANAKIRSERMRGAIRLGVTLPTRAELGIAAGDKFYYPYAVEYGHSGAPAYPFIRPAVDDHEAEEVAAIGRDIGAGIEKEARRK